MTIYTAYCDHSLSPVWFDATNIMVAQVNEILAKLEHVIL